MLNVSADHLDRYARLADYAAAKARIFARCDTAVINLDDPLVARMPRARGAHAELLAARRDRRRLRAAPSTRRSWWLTRARRAAAGRWRELKLTGLHNAANALAALALGEALELPLAGDARGAQRASPACRTARSGWPRSRGVRYIDDSKGTNVGATLAAVAGLPGPLVVIAGGDGKDQDFAPLRRGAFAARCATRC